MTGFSLLPVGQEEGHDGQTQKFNGVARILGPRWAHLPTMTIGLLGVQVFWSVEMSYASPYLLSLGLSKSSMAIVFVAGPLSGLIMQPLIGALADNSTSRFGRRRPYMLMGTVVCMVAMLLLGFTRPVASIFTSWHSSANNILTISLAILSIYLIDFAINAVQAVDRALLVDTLPPSRQATGNAWAARMLGVGGVVGFFIGNINLPRIFPFLGKTQLEVLSVVVSILLLLGHMVMAILIKERVLRSKVQRKSFRQEVKDIWSNIRTLPHIIRQICIIQFFAWLAWFPCLFYSTIYIGDIYKRISPVATTDDEQLLLDAEATRLGSRALFFSSILSLFINVTLPAFVSESSTRTNDESWWHRISRVPKCLQIDLATLWAIGHLVFAACMFATFFTHSILGSTIIITVTGFSWAVTQWVPFSLLAEAILTEGTPQVETVAIRLADTRSPHPRTVEDHEREHLVPGRDSEDDDDDDDDDEARRRERSRMLRHSDARVSRIDLTEPQEDDGYEVVHHDNVSRVDMRPLGASGRHEHEEGSLSSKAGIILGIHNIFIVIPQFLVTGFSALLFALVDPEKPALPGHAPVAPHPGPATNLTRGFSMNVTDSIINLSGHMSRSTEVWDAAHSDSVVYIFRIGGVAASFAFVLCWRLARELRHR